jgi:hypothetical protein
MKKYYRRLKLVVSTANVEAIQGLPNQISL